MICYKVEFGELILLRLKRQLNRGSKKSILLRAVDKGMIDPSVLMLDFIHYDVFIFFIKLHNLL